MVLDKPVPEEAMLPFPLRLVCNVLWMLFALKLCFYLTNHSHRKSIYLVSFVQDAFLFIANYFVFIFVLKRFRLLHRTGEILFYALLVLIGAVSFIYTFFLFDLLSFPVNIFAIRLQNASFFIEYFMSVKLLVILVGGMGILFGISHYFPIKIFWSKIPIIFSVLVSLLFVPTILRPAINPLVYSLQEQIMLSFSGESYLTKLQPPIPDPELKLQFHFLDRSFETIPKIKPKYKRVIVLVMEGVNYKDYYDKSTGDKNSFINRHQDNVATWHNYHTLNLDSYTSLLAMLNSIFIPYQAYVDESKYRFVNKRNNLIRFFNANGFSTHFITSYGEQQKRFVPDAVEWSEMVFMKDIENNTKYASITSSKIDYACEDLAVFDDLIEILKTNTQAFVLQEMAYGHSSQWKEKTGLETIDYYNQYFNKIVAALTTNKLLEGTLLIISSDHGPRDNTYASENYHVPLLIWAQDIEKTENHKFISHLDFKDILLQVLTGKEIVSKRETIYTMGNSGEYIYGKITADGEFIFINNRMSNVKSNADQEIIKAFNSTFQDYLNYFASLKAK